MKGKWRLAKFHKNKKMHIKEIPTNAVLSFLSLSSNFFILVRVVVDSEPMTKTQGMRCHLRAPHTLTFTAKNQLAWRFSLFFFFLGNLRTRDTPKTPQRQKIRLLLKLGSMYSIRAHCASWRNTAERFLFSIFSTRIHVKMYISRARCRFWIKVVRLKPFNLPANV